MRWQLEHKIMHFAISFFKTFSEEAILHASEISKDFSAGIHGESPWLLGGNKLHNQCKVYFLWLLVLFVCIYFFYQYYVVNIFLYSNDNVSFDTQTVILLLLKALLLLFLRV